VTRKEYTGLPKITIVEAQQKKYRGPPTDWDTVWKF